MKLFLSPDELASPEAAGPKAHGMKRMRHLGYRVPRFFVTPASLSELLLSRPDLRTLLAQEACARHSSPLWAIRSNSFDEDGPNRSRAGRFESMTGVEAKGIADAIERVLSQARRATGGDLSRFSLIIQEYLPAEYEGVIFTRNPLGTRDLVVEYSSGSDARITSGESPRSRVFRHHSDLIRKPPLLPPALADILLRMPRLEAESGFPLDLEWCIHQGHFYVLQCRPVTTLDRGQHEAMLEL